MHASEGRRSLAAGSIWAGSIPWHPWGCFLSYTKGKELETLWVMNKMHVTFPLCLSGLCSWKESPPPPSYPNAACTVLGVNSSTINRKYAFSVLLCFETAVISSTLFQFRLCHSRSTMREWKGNWVGHPKTLWVLACIPQYMGAVQGLSQGYAVGKEKNLEPFKSRIDPHLEYSSPEGRVSFSLLVF